MNNVKIMLQAVRKPLDRRPRDLCFGCRGSFLTEELVDYYIFPRRFENDPDFPVQNPKVLACNWCNRVMEERTGRFDNFPDWHEYWQLYNFGCGLFVGRPGRPKPVFWVLYPIVKPNCHKCGERVGAEDKLHRPYSIHHINPQRNFGSRQEASWLGNLAYTHNDCHTEIHRDEHRRGLHMPKTSRVHQVAS